MPRAVYIICSGDVVEDRLTNLLSVFSIAERLEVRRANVVRDVEIADFRCAVVAVWMKTPNDDGELFEHVFTVVNNPLDELDISPIIQFRFLSDEMHLHRFRIRVEGFPPIVSSGIVLFRSKIRKLGDTDWLVQEFPMVAHVTETDETIEISHS